MKHLIATIALLSVSACGNMGVLNGKLFEYDDPQNDAGLSKTTLEFCKNKLGGFEICKAVNVDGKEHADISLKWSVDQDGIFQVEYTAKDTRAFEAFKTIADVRARFGDIVADTLTKLAVPGGLDISTENSDN